MPSTGEAQATMYPATGSVGLPPLLKRFQLWTVLFWAFSVCFHLFNRYVRVRGGMLAFPLSTDNERFGDFLIFAHKFRFFHTAEFFQTGFPINYPAPVCLVFEIFFRYAGRHALGAFVLFTVLSFVVPCALFARAMVRRGIGMFAASFFVTTCCVLSWPFLLILDRGNVEIAVFLALAIGMWAYATGRLWIAAALFGIAASMKLFPFVFLALFLSRQRMGQLLFGAASFFVASIVSLEILGPTIATAYNGIAFGLGSFKQNYMAVWLTNEGGVDHSIFATYKGLMVLWFHHPERYFTTALSVYLALTALIGIVLYFLVIRRLPLLNQVLALSIASIYFTAFSGDGTLIHLYYPLAMLFFLAIQAYRDRVTIPGLPAALGCMAVCLSIETFLVVHEVPVDVRLIGPVHCVALGALFVIGLRYPLGPALAEPQGERVLSQPSTEWVRRPATV